MSSPFNLLSRFVVLVLAWPALAGAQVSLSVNANQTVRTVDERVFGVNAVVWDGNTATPQTISLLQAAGVRTIRIPGGSLSDEYHWRTNTNLANTWTWSAGFDKYTTLITGLNAQAFVTVNYGTGTPQEAAAWVAYANAPANILGTGSDVAIGVDAKGYDWKTAGYWSALRNSAPLGTNDGMNFLRISRVSPIGLQYWEIGNENYGTWESDEQAVRNDPYTYAIRTKDYMAMMKAVDPTIKIGVVVQTGEDDNINNTSHPATNPRTGAVHNGWTPVMLTTLKAAPAVTPDYLIYHRYEQAPKADAIGWGGAYESDATLLQKAKTWPNDAAALRQQLSDYLGGPGAGVQLIVTENNSVYGKPGKQTTSLVNGLYLADSVCNVMQTEISGLLWWDLRNGVETGNNNDATLYGWRNYGDYGILASASGSTTVYDPYPTYYLMKLLSHFARNGDTVVQAASNNPLLSIFSVKRADGSLCLLVINKDPANALSATIALTGYTPSASAVTFSYGKPQDTAGSAADIVTTLNVPVAGATFSASFDSYSATVIALNDNVAPQITTPPVSQAVTAGTSVTFSAAASGKPAPTYQWQKGGVDIGGATGSSYTLASPVVGDAGTYSVVATNSLGSAVSSGATLTINTIPAITTQPIGQTVTAGTSVTFSAVASGLPAPTYQWKKGGVDIGGATDASYTIGSSVIGDFGTYTVVATNVAGFATSDGAVLMVNPAPSAPAITTQPVNQTVAAGSAATFTAAASGYPAPTYQWKKNGVVIAGATGSTYTITSALVADVNSYTMVATNASGSATSNPATLSLSVAASGTVPAGFDATGYLARYADVSAVFAGHPYAAWLYYRDYGIYQGQVFDELFRVEEYLTLYPELFAVFGSDLSGALMHWLTQGSIEGRLGRIPLVFDAQGYLDRNPDVAAAVGGNTLLAWQHYWAYGIYEGRSYDDELNVFEYLAVNADLTAAFVNDWRAAALHWMRYGRTEGRLGRVPLIFNVNEYLTRYPDVGAAWGTYPTTVFLHFWLYGIDELKNFDEEFRVDEYLALNPDLAAIFGADRRGAFKHWVRYGRTEGRLGRNP